MSAAHAAVRAYLALSGQWRPWRSAEALDASLRRRRPWPPEPPRSGRGVTVSARDQPGMRIVRLTPLRPSGGTLVALHGGAYVGGPEPQHWTMWRRLALASGRTVVAPLYRLAPAGTAAATVPALADLVARQESPTALLGDSAGAGLALAVALELRERGLRPPLLLSAPWLDASLTQPWILDRDPWLAAPGLRRAADLWRGDLPVDHPWVSPLNADLAGLGPIVAASGTRDILHRDALRLQESVPLGHPVRLLVGEGLLHNYPLLPIPEARPALAAFAAALR